MSTISDFISNLSAEELWDILIEPRIPFFCRAMPSPAPDPKTVFCTCLKVPGRLVDGVEVLPPEAVIAGIALRGYSSDISINEYGDQEGRVHPLGSFSIAAGSPRPT